METTATSLLSHWESFYVIVGSSGAALTGLMFVVITLIADSPVRPTRSELNGFATPTVVHFTSVLVMAAILAAPWSHLGTVGHVISLMGIAGVIYAGIVLRRLRQPSSYHKVLEDWVWHMILPISSYIALFVGGLGLRQHAEWAPYAIGAVAVILLPPSLLKRG